MTMKSKADTRQRGPFTCGSVTCLKWQTQQQFWTELFLTAGEDVRGAIETGFLEHVLETAALRPYFDHWSSDTRLKEAWERAMEWGKAHPDYTWGLLKQLRKLESK